MNPTVKMTVTESVFANIAQLFLKKSILPQRVINISKSDILRKPLLKEVSGFLNAPSAAKHAQHIQIRLRLHPAPSECIM